MSKQITYLYFKTGFINTLSALSIPSVDYNINRQYDVIYSLEIITLFM